MAVNIKAGHFQNTTGGSDQSITGLGFVPKFLLNLSASLIAFDAFAVGTMIAVNMARGTTGNESHQFGTGFTTNRNTFTNRAYGGAGRRGGEIISENEALTNGVVTAVNFFSLQSFDADGWTQDPTLNSVAARHPYLAIGGDGVTVPPFQHPAARTTAGDQSITGAGVRPGLAFFVMSLGDEVFCFGWTDGTRNGCVAIQSQHNVATGVCHKVVSDEYCLAWLNPNTGALEGTARCTGFTDDGLELTYDSASASADDFSVAMIAGVIAHAFSETQPTAPGPVVVDALDCLPRACLLLSGGAVEDAAPTADLRISLGIADASVSAGVWSGDVTGSTNDSTRRNLRRADDNHALVMAHPTSNTAGTIDASATVSSFGQDANGGKLTVAFDVADATARQFLGLAIGPAAPGGSTFTRDQAWRSQPLDGYIAWVEFYGKAPNGDPQTFFWSELPVAGINEYLDGRCIEFGDLERALSDRYGQLEGSRFTFTVADTDRAIRRFFDNVYQRAVYGVEVTVKVQRLEDLYAERIPTVVFRGLVSDYDAPPGFRFRFECEDFLSSQIGQGTPLPLIKAAFPSAPADTRDTHGELWYGHLSDAASATPGPLPAAEAASGASVVTSILGQAGIGELGHTPPAGLAIVDDGAGDLQAGNVVYGMVTRVVAGVESDPYPFLTPDSITIAGSGVGVRMTCTPDGADSYRFYAAAFYAPSVRFNQFIETNDPTTGVVFTKIPGLGSIAIQDESNITPGASQPSYLGLFVYGATAQLADGRTVMTSTWNAGSGPFRRPIRLCMTPVVGAIAYQIWRRDVGSSIFTRRWTIAPSSVNGDGNIVFDDSLIDDPSTFVDGLTAPRGVVPCKRVGQVLDLDGFPWEALAIGCSALFEVEDLFFVMDDTVTRVDDGMYGSSFLSPDKPNFGLHFANRYYDAPNGTRWTLVFARGPHGSFIADGTASLRANIKGIESQGDGTGTFLETLPDQLAHFLDNFPLADPEDVYDGGEWLQSIPEWLDGTPRREAPSFAAAAAAMAAVGLPTAGAWGVRSPETMLAVIAGVVITGDLAYGPSREGAVLLVLEDPLPAPVVADEVYDTDLDSEDESFEWDDETNPSWFYNEETVEHTPQYEASGQTYTQKTTSDTTTRYKVRKAPSTVQLVATRSEVGAWKVGQRRIDRAKHPPRSAPFRTGLQAALHELGFMLDLTAPEGPGAEGWVAALAMIRRIRASYATGRVTLSVRATVSASAESDTLLEDLMAEYPLGGSLVDSPSLTGVTPETVDAFDPPGYPVRIPWSGLPTTLHFEAVGRARVDAGITSIKVIVWCETDAVQVGESAVITANVLTTFTIPVTNPGLIDKEYSMKAVVVDGDPLKAVHFKGQLRPAA